MGAVHFEELESHALHMEVWMGMVLFLLFLSPVIYVVVAFSFSLLLRYGRTFVWKDSIAALGIASAGVMVLCEEAFKTTMLKLLAYVMVIILVVGVEDGIFLKETKVVCVKPDGAFRRGSTLDNLRSIFLLSRILPNCQGCERRERAQA